MGAAPHIAGRGGRGSAPLVGLAALAWVWAFVGSATAQPYGLISRIQAKPGQGEALAGALPSGCAGMAGCLAYLTARDAADPDALWVTEAWIDKAAHDASLALPQVRAAITRGRPLIASFGETHETRPVPETSASPR
jgi:quinol monooxygenase YgiN